MFSLVREINLQPKYTHPGLSFLIRIVQGQENLDCPLKKIIYRLKGASEFFIVLCCASSAWFHYWEDILTKVKFDWPSGKICLKMANGWNKAVKSYWRFRLLDITLYIVLYFQTLCTFLTGFVKGVLLTTFQVSSINQFEVMNHQSW